MSESSPASSDLAAAEAAPAAQGQFINYPGSPFELYQPYPPAGDQPVAIDTLVQGVQDGEVFQALLGVTGLSLIDVAP